VDYDFVLILVFNYKYIYNKNIARLMDEIMIQTDKKKHEIFLLGQKFSIRSEKSEQYINDLAKYIANQIESIRRQTRSVSTPQVTLLLALNLADQLFEKEQQLEALQESLEKKANEALDEVNEALAKLAENNLNTATDS
jgi:cell division protein ZapA